MTDSPRINVSVNPIYDTTDNTSEIPWSIDVPIDLIGNRRANAPGIRPMDVGPIAVTIDPIRQRMPEAGRIDIAPIKSPLLRSVSKPAL